MTSLLRTDNCELSWIQLRSPIWYFNSSPIHCNSKPVFNIFKVIVEISHEQRFTIIQAFYWLKLILLERWIVTALGTSPNKVTTSTIFSFFVFSEFWKAFIWFLNLISYLFNSFLHYLRIIPIYEKWVNEPSDVKLQISPGSLFGITSSRKTVFPDLLQIIFGSIPSLDIFISWPDSRLCPVSIDANSNFAIELSLERF